ncbi:hypothetical protein EP7_000302 [Isosphaeraceae bacterium EP7]
MRLHPPSLSPRITLGLGLLFGTLAAGCGSDGPTMGRVSGTVTVIDGEPLSKGTVTFIATDTTRPNATGTIGDGGYYTLQTTEPGDGAVVGDYKVAISDVDSTQLNTALPGMPVKVPKSAIAKTYSDPDKSGLTATVEAGSNTKNFEVKKAAATAAAK